MALRRTRLYALLFLVIVSSLAGYLYLNRTNVERDIYFSVLERLSQKIPISNFTLYSHPSTCRGANRDNLPEAGQALMEAFHRSNDVVTGEPLQLTVSGKIYHIISRQDSKRIFAGEQPKLTNTPKRLINLSRIGIDKKKHHALLCVESEESGDLVYLEKHDGQWQIIKWQYVW
jgi:hypothetical protein